MKEVVDFVNLPQKIIDDKIDTPPDMQISYWEALCDSTGVESYSFQPTEEMKETELYKYVMANIPKGCTLVQMVAFNIYPDTVVEPHTDYGEYNAIFFVNDMGALRCYEDDSSFNDIPLTPGKVIFLNTSKKKHMQVPPLSGVRKTIVFKFKAPRKIEP